MVLCLLILLINVRPKRDDRRLTSVAYVYIYINVGERHVRFYYTHLFGVRCGDDNLISLS